MQDESRKKILLTGATGFLGSYLLRALLDKGWDVAIIKRSFSSTHRIQDLLPKVAILDIDTESLESIFEQRAPFDAVVHTATCYGRNGETACQVMDANLSFPLKLLETACLFNTARFYNTSTFFNQISLNYSYLGYYAISKRHFEDWGTVFSDQNKISFINLKLEHVYGPEDDSSKFTSFIFDCLKRNISEIELTLGEQKRDFIYVDDVVRAYILLLEDRKALSREYEIGSGKAITVREFVEKAKSIAGAQTKLMFGAKEYRKNEIMFSQADTRKIFKAINWAARCDLCDGIRKCLAAI